MPITDDEGYVEESFLENGTGFYPFSQVPVWITLNASPNAVLVYVFLKTYTGQTTQVAFPSRETIASGALKTKQARSVDRYIAELEHIGALAKKQRRNSGNFKIKNIYRLEWAPPEDFDGPVNRQQWEEMGSPLAEAVPIFKGNSKKPAYTVMRYSALRDEQEKHSPDTETETDKTENPSSVRSAPERTSMCAKTHSGSAPERTGIRSKPPISKDSLPPLPPRAEAAVPQDASVCQGGEEDSARFEADAKQVWLSVLGETEQMSVAQKWQLVRRLSQILSSGCTVQQATDRLKGVATADSVFGAACSRLSGLEGDFGDQDPSGDPFASQEATEAAERATPKHCGRCSDGPRTRPEIYRRVINPDGSYGEMCAACNPNHPKFRVKENA